MFLYVALHIEQCNSIHWPWWHLVSLERDQQCERLPGERRLFVRNRSENSGARFLESPDNFSDPELYFKIKICKMTVCLISQTSST